MINEISNMLSLVFPSVIQILETFKCTLKSIMANNCVVQHANFGLERTLKRFKDLKYQRTLGNTNDNMFDISLIIVLVVRK